jgi:predicted outer membrane repeat protein
VIVDISYVLITIPDMKSLQNQALQKGGGIYMDAQSSASITVCSFSIPSTNVNHSTDFWQQEEVSISSNRAAEGAGLYASSASLTIHGTVSVSENTATGYFGGGGMFLLQSTMMVPATEEASALMFRANRAKSGTCCSLVCSSAQRASSVQL